MCNLGRFRNLSTLRFKCLAFVCDVATESLIVFDSNFDRDLFELSLAECDSCCFKLEATSERELLSRGELIVDVEVLLDSVVGLE